MSPTANTVFPSFGIDKRIPDFLARFYRISDDENTADEYLTLFTPDASFQFLSIRLNGTEGHSPPKKWGFTK
jgi:3-phenylpropionate/cinnamic acid dioxygenase small subunit